MLRLLRRHKRADGAAFFRYPSGLPPRGLFEYQLGVFCRKNFKKRPRLPFRWWTPFDVLGGRALPPAAYALLTVQSGINEQRTHAEEERSAVAANCLASGYVRSGFHRLCTTRLLLLFPFLRGMAWCLQQVLLDFHSPYLTARTARTATTATRMLLFLPEIMRLPVLCCQLRQWKGG